MNTFELIIFDCDGVIVDSERITNQVYADLLDETCGLQFSLEQMYDTFVGLSSKQCLGIIRDLLGKEPPNQLQTRYKKDIEIALKNSVVAVNGIKGALNDLNIPYCIASNSHRQRIDASLIKSEMHSFFEGKIYSVEDVKRAKPFPDIYLLAAQKMGCVEPSKCLVIEDSPTGVKSGIAAGMTVFGFSELMPEKKLLDAGAHHTFNNMSQLNHEIQQYQNTQL